MLRLFSLVWCILAIAMVSCDSNRVYDNYQSISNGWNKDAEILFRVEEPDTIQPYNLFINLRNNHEFNFSNLFLIAQMEFPNGMVVTDTLEYKMAAPNGEWLGTGFGNLIENKLWYKEQVRFTETGEYKFAIRHAMRRYGSEEGIENLDGIIEVGFRIEKIPN